MKVVRWLITVAVACWWRQGGALAMPGACTTQCGNVTVPYPFGLEANCARSTEFLLNCTNIEGSGIQLLSGKLQIRKISVGDSTMVVSLPELYECYDQNGAPVNKSGPLAFDLSPYTRYRWSDTLNKLTVLGCNTYASVFDSKGTFGSGCISYCSGGDVNFTKENTCSGQGCCQASIPKGLKTLNINISSVGNNVLASQFNHCRLAFVVDNRSFNVTNWTLPRFEDVGKSQGLVLDWMVESNVTCRKATQNKPTYACGNHAECQDFGPGYRCVCKAGYEGNPYNPKEGCKDINECKYPEKYPCHGKCRNTSGSYSCRCRPGKKGKGKDHCKVSPAGIAFGALAVSMFGITVTASVSVTWSWRIRKMNFRRNGGDNLKHHGVIYTAAELAKATNNYGDSNKLSHGGFSSTHRGTIAGDVVVVVKKPKDAHKSLIKEDFQHELEILMKRSHKNVVKLKGICLETRIPSLVYEYIPNGTLFQHIHQNASTILKTWDDRLKIAAEAALALDYMHSCIEPPIVHGNIKSANILVDQDNLVKVSDFGTSVLISPEHSHVVATQKQGSLGYTDPEYLITGVLTVQSDVYSFGVVLVELLTGKKLSVTKSGESINIIHRFISSVKDNTLSDVVNFEGASEDEKKMVGMVAEIAVKCLDQSGANRPAMSEVAQQLASINPSSTVEENMEETEFEADTEKPSPLGEASCLSCPGMDSACSCF